MKAGIITIYDNVNYGNRLQNYAVSMLLKMHGVESETLRIYPHGLAPIIKIGLGCKDKLTKKRQKAFDKFTQKFLPTRLISNFSTKKLPLLNQEFDFFFAGSDQIWNPYFFTSKHANLLMFADKNKSMSISGSFGVSSIPKRFEKTYKKGFEGFEHISVREYEGKKIIDELLGKEVATVLPDPTMLLSQEEWLEVAKDEESEKEKYILTYFLGKKGDSFKHIEKIAKDNNLKIIHLNQKCQPEHFAASPEKFIKLFSEAELVCTNSYHGCVFAVKFEKPFLLFKRDSYNIDMSSRTKTLFKMFNLQDRTFGKLDKQEYFKIHYDKTAIQNQIERGHEFIKLCLSEKMISITDKSKCCGCTACASVCPAQCISMESDDEGFKYPKVDKTKCLNCGLCKSVCPIIHPFNNQNVAQQVFYGHNKNAETLEQSSSGGVFSLLAEKIISEGGVVFGAMFDDSLKVVHGYIEDLSQLNKLRGSKYVQSDMNACFKKAKEFLLQGRPVLFTGTPCQIVGLKKFLRKEYDNLFTQDVICHGVPSPLVWEKYKEQEILKHNSKLTKVSFRDKSANWLNFHFAMEFEDGQKCSEAHSKNQFMKAFLSNKCLRESCYRCPFKGGGRGSDITLADFWGANVIRPNTYNKMGTSLIITNTKKGAAFFDSVKQNMEARQIGIKLPALFNPSFAHSKRKPTKRELFMKNIKHMPFEAARKKSH